MTAHRVPVVRQVSGGRIQLQPIFEEHVAPAACTGTARATSALGLPVPHLHWDCPCHICTGTELIAATSAQGLHQDSAETAGRGGEGSGEKTSNHTGEAGAERPCDRQVLGRVR